MTLTFTLTDTEYVAVMHALKRAARQSSLVGHSGLVYLSDVEKLELEHLRTLLAEASINHKDST
jgi:hypothetical protein